MSDQIEETIVEHMDVLVNQIGERPGGSQACLRAEQYLEDVFSSHGWMVERQSFECPVWTDLGTTLRLNGRLVEASANAYSQPCTVSSTAAPLGTLAELEAADLYGQIAVLYGALVPQPLAPKSWFLKSERDDRIIQVLETKQPAAIITVQKIGGGRERLIEDWEFDIPSATVTADVGLEILRAGNPVLELEIDSQKESGQTANIVGRSRLEHGRVVLCAHHDTKVDTPGACDNASGVAVLLALAEILDGNTYPFTIELVSFTNEEYMPIGDDEYLRRNGSEDLTDIIACINTDGVGQWLAPDSITIIGASKAFEKLIVELSDVTEDLVWADPWPESNHSTFSFRGVPSVAFTSTNRVALAHHPYDDLQWTNPLRISRLIPTIVKILDTLATKQSDWSRSG
jgi:aminopeptidase YwaD